MKYPFWLPKPRRHWLRAIELGLLSLPVCLVFFIVLKLGAAISIPLLLNGKIFNIWGILWLSALLLVPPYLLAHFHQFFHDDPRDDYPDWLPRPRCLMRGAVNWLVFILAVAVTLILWIDWEFVENSSNFQVQEYLKRKTPLLNISWVVSSAYLFYLGDGIGWFFRELGKFPSALLGKKRKSNKPQKTNLKRN